MAKGSVRKKGKKWYYRFYVEDASGNLVQKECVGTESKSETEKLLRQAMDDYEKKKFVAKADNLTVGQLLDVWAEEELKTGTLSNGTVENYLGTIRNIKKHPLAERKLKNVTSEHLQSFFDLLSFGGVHPDGKERKGYSKDYIHSFSAVMQQSFRFAVFPKQYITFNPMQYIKLRYQTDEVDLFSDEDMDGNVQPISREDYEKKKFVAKAENLTVGQLLDVWAEEELKTGTLSNGTVENYLGTIRNIKKHPLAERKLKNVTSEHLQSFFDLLSFGGVHPDGKERKGYSKDYIHSFSAVMQQSFRFAVFPKQYITFNPMQYIKLRYQTDEVDLFSDEDMDGNVQPISREDYERLLAYLQKKNPAAILPIQIAYYAGLRIGEACGLAWQDVNLEEQCLTIRRSIRYDGSKRKYIIGPTKRKKVRVVDFGDTLVEIFRNARKEQLKNRMQYEELYHTNYYKEVKEKNRVYYEYYCLDRTQEVPADYKEISFVCLRPDGCLELPTTLGTVCRKVAKALEGFEGFHFHQLRHTYTSNLLANGAAPKDVQELLGHSDVSTTMNVYAHSTRDAKRKSVRLLDKVVGND